MRLKYFLLLLATALFLISACSSKVLPEKSACNKPYASVGNNCCLDANNNSLCDSNETEATPAENQLGGITGNVIDESAKDLGNPAVENMPKPKTEEKADSNYDLAQLEDDINEIMDSPYYSFERDPSHPDHVRSSKLKYYVINTIGAKESIDNAPKFCSKYCANDWDGWKYFINMSSFRALHPILTRENFSDDYEYKDYVQHSGYVRFTIKEKPYEVANGKVMEYQLYLDLMDLFGNFKGVYDESLIIYKVYCSKNMTVLLRPRWDTFNKIYWSAATMEEVDKTWDSYIIPVRKEFLSKANELLGKCPVKKEFFEGYSFPDYSKSETLSFYWRPYYKFYLNLTRVVSIGVEPSREEGEYVLKEINLSFTNNDEFELYELALDIVVTPDNERAIDYYSSKNRFVGVLRPGKSADRSFSLKDIKFSNNITIDANLYTIEDKGVIRPQKFVFTKEDIKDKMTSKST